MLEPGDPGLLQYGPRGAGAAAEELRQRLPRAAHDVRHVKGVCGAFTGLDIPPVPAPVCRATHAGVGLPLRGCCVQDEASKRFLMQKTYSTAVFDEGHVLRNGQVSPAPLHR